MPITLIATPGDAAANSYADIATAQGLLDLVPNSDAWQTGSDRQAQALAHATSMLDALAYQGYRTTAAQALQWPRGGVLDPDYGDPNSAYAGYMVAGNWGVYLDQNTIPKRIVRACTALALEILRAGTSDVWGVEPNANIQRKGVDVLSTEYVRVAERRFGLRYYPQVWRWVYPLTLQAKPDRVERS